MVELTAISRLYRRGDGTEVAALSDVSLSIDSGEFVAVRGSSGSGKSSLLNILGCLDTPTAGTYRLNGADVSSYTDRQRSGVRCQQVGFIFQSFNLLARTTALENVEMPMIYRGHRPDRAKARRLLERVGLGDRLDHFGTELSGGQQQRVAIARALINDPPLLLADEPTGNLDAASGEAILQLLAALHAEGRTIVLVTHDEQVAASVPRELQLREGRLVADVRRDATAVVTAAE